MYVYTINKSPFTLKTCLSIFLWRYRRTCRPFPRIGVTLCTYYLPSPTLALAPLLLLILRNSISLFRCECLRLMLAHLLFISFHLFPPPCPTTQLGFIQVNFPLLSLLQCCPPPQPVGSPPKWGGGRLSLGLNHYTTPHVFSWKGKARRPWGMPSPLASAIIQSTMKLSSFLLCTTRIVSLLWEESSLAIDFLSDVSFSNGSTQRIHVGRFMLQKNNSLLTLQEWAPGTYLFKVQGDSDAQALRTTSGLSSLVIVDSLCSELLWGKDFDEPYLTFQLLKMNQRMHLYGTYNWQHALKDKSLLP